MKRIAFVGTVGAGKQRYLMRCGELYPRKEKHRPWNLMIMAILIRRVNILAIPAGITP